MIEKFYNFFILGFDFDSKNKIAKFNYSFDNKEFFQETIFFGQDDFFIRKDFSEKIFNNFLFSLSIALAISYYKLFPTKKIIIEKGYLSEEDKIFWKKFFINGLGEFFYKNKINPLILEDFIVKEKKEYKKVNFKISENVLLPVGGGKDSIVSQELLKKNNILFNTVVFGQVDKIKENTIKISGNKFLNIKRELSDNLFRLNKKGYYNGHVPITGIISFILLSQAYLYDYKYIIFSNEKSSNYGNTKIGDFEVNHQYSKSLDFENDIGEYIKRNLSDEISVFSLLRGMYEIKIAKIFSELGKKYFSVFSSCNNNFKILKNKQEQNKKLWCNNCPKCLFVYCILRPYLNSEEVQEIFSKELFFDDSLEKSFRELLGIDGIKPFECVGEAQEVILAFNKSLEIFKKENKKLPNILKIFEEEIKNNKDEKYFKDLEKKYFDLDLEFCKIPKEFKLILKGL